MGALHFTPRVPYLGALPLAAAAGWVGWSAAIGIAAGLCLLATLWFGVARTAGRRLAAVPTG